GRREWGSCSASCGHHFAAERESSSSDRTMSACGVARNMRAQPEETPPMSAARDDYLTPEAIEVIESARALAPRLAERAEAAERPGGVPAETIREMQAAGLFRVLQPKRWGGLELDPRVFYRVQMALAEGCMSTAWIYGVIGVHNWELPLFAEAAQQEVWGKSSATLIASTYMPVGRAERVEGGWRFSGRWGFSSGIEHCEWVFLGGLLPKAGGGFEHNTFLLPKSDCRV